MLLPAPKPRYWSVLFSMIVGFEYVVSTFVFKTFSEKNILTIIFVVINLHGFGLNNVGPASQRVARHYFTIGSMHRVVRVAAFRGVKRLNKTRDNHPILC